MLLLRLVLLYYGLGVAGPYVSLLEPAYYRLEVLLPLC